MSIFSYKEDDVLEEIIQLRIEVAVLLERQRVLNEVLDKLIAEKNANKEAGQ